ncbi:uncharacterized protein FTJAE_3727 [Fusarium tjaetaba]|uniref:Uncharacterized protein n=1 Tax=Fusarium tjaetaba TaxID=1567544 RepID=A0A8H5RYK9_9HYPO|nr:uncharacterized protein FTJAE_3727 [Fusarium tjaetaba]KAF5642252.1 hypothetical protein FTJAE_3727 [Fusarium tjaetaba]
MGSSDHFRTEHGVIGLVTVVFAGFASLLYFFDFFFGSRMARTIMGMRWRQNLKYFDMFVCQVILMLSGFVLTDGFDDLSVMGLCYIQISLAWAVSIGMIAAFVWNSAMVLMTAQWFLVRRARPNGGVANTNNRMWRLVRFRRRPRREPSPEPTAQAYEMGSSSETSETCGRGTD